jgi:hypothetical protein
MLEFMICSRAAPVCAPKGPDLNFHTITFGPVKIRASRDNEILITRTVDR